MKRKLTALLLSLAVLICGAAGITTIVAGAEETVGTAEIIGSVTGGDNGFVTEEEWETVYSHAMTGANTSVIKFALVNKDLFLKAVLGDETNFDGKDRFGYEIKIGETSYSSQGHFENNNGAPVWETGGFDKVQSERYYDASLKAYVMYVGIDLGSDYGAGNTVTVTFTHNDATTADAAWGSGEATTFSGTLYLVSKPAVEYTYVVPMIEGALTASDWDRAEVYEMTPVAETEGATGTVSLIVAGKTLYFKVNVNDSTQIVPDANTDGSTNDRPSYSLTIGGKTQYQRGKYAVNWMVGDKGLGEPTLYEDSKGDGTYSITAAYDLGDLAVKGAWLTVDFSHADAQTAENGWADSIASYPHAIRFAHKLYLGEVTEKDPLEKDIEPEPEVPVDPDPTEGPENTDLEIVITDLVSMPTESDWNNAETYDLIKLHGNSEGATGTVKVYTAAQNIFYRMTVNDPTTNYKADGIYVYLAGYDDEGNEVIYYEARGNYDMWLADKERLLGSPSLLTMSTTAENASGYGEGVYTFSQGFYIPDIYAVGGKVHLILKHRDSRRNSEAWADGDYFHTIYFDQVMTFGDAADTTVRPQDATEGFTVSAANVSYNKADICWNEVADADTYKIWLYKVNPEGSDEPYEYISNEGPIYSGDATYAETLNGLSATTDYAVQIIAYDENETVIACSVLVKFKTISKAEALQDSASDGASASDADSVEESSHASGCLGGVGAISVLALPLIASAFIVFKKKEN